MSVKWSRRNRRRAMEGRLGRHLFHLEWLYAGDIHITCLQLREKRAAITQGRKTKRSIFGRPFQ